MAANGLSLLRNIIDCIHFWQIFADTVMGGSPFQQNTYFSSAINVCYVDMVMSGLALTSITLTIKMCVRYGGLHLFV